MAAQKGSALLLKIGADNTAAASADTYTTVGGLRSTSISHNEEAVDVTEEVAETPVNICVIPIDKEPTAVVAC